MADNNYELAKVVNVERIYISNKEAQDYLGMSPDFFHQLRRSGQLPYYNLGGKAVFYKLSDINKLIEKAIVKL